jgi:hypothetical protein
MRKPLIVEELSKASSDESSDLRLLFHRLHNQLGTILAHAELIEAKAANDLNRARAAQVVASALEAIETAADIRRQTCGCTRSQ